MRLRTKTVLAFDVELVSPRSCMGQGSPARAKSITVIVGAEATAGVASDIGCKYGDWPGTNTIFSQIASEALGIDYDLVEVVQPDTKPPNSGPTVASRTSMVVGKLIESASSAEER